MLVFAQSAVQNHEKINQQNEHIKKNNIIVL